MGVRSTGKTMLANELVRHLSEENFIIDGFDHTVEKLDKKYWSTGELHRERAA